MIIFAEYLIHLIDFYTASLLCRQLKALMLIATVFSSCIITIALFQTFIFLFSISFLFQFVCFNLTVIAIFPKETFSWRWKKDALLQKLFCLCKNFLSSCHFIIWFCILLDIYLAMCLSFSKIWVYI